MPSAWGAASTRSRPSRCPSSPPSTATRSEAGWSWAALPRAGGRRPRARGRRGPARPADGRGAGAGGRDRRQRSSRRPGAQAPGQRVLRGRPRLVAGAVPRAAPPARPHPGHARGGPRLRREAGAALRGSLTVDFELDEAQRAVQQGVRQVARAFDLDYWREVDARHRFPEEFWRALADGGWLGIVIPPEYGGSGLGTLELAIAIEEVAASGAGVAAGA